MAPKGERIPPPPAAPHPLSRGSGTHARALGALAGLPGEGSRRTPTPQPNTHPSSTGRHAALRGDTPVPPLTRPTGRWASPNARNGYRERE